MIPLHGISLVGGDEVQHSRTSLETSLRKRGVLPRLQLDGMIIDDHDRPSKLEPRCVSGMDGPISPCFSGKRLHYEMGLGRVSESSECGKRPSFDPAISFRIVSVVVLMKL